MTEGQEFSAVTVAKEADAEGFLKRLLQPETTCVGSEGRRRTSSLIDNLLAPDRPQRGVRTKR